MSLNDIHPTALIAAGATLGEGNVIGPYAVIGESVVLGDGNWIGAGATLGAPPEIRGGVHETFGHQATEGNGLIIGDRCVIREQVTIGRGWAETTRMFNDCYVMAGSYIAHDCVLGSNVTLSSGTRLAGHVRVGPYANLGMGGVVHQRLTVGPAAMIGMAAVVTRDVPAFAKAFGSPARVQGTNDYLLKKFGTLAGAAEEIARTLREDGSPSDAQLTAVSADLWSDITEWRSASGA